MRNTTENKCETCVKRHICNKDMGNLFGFCMLEYRPDFDALRKGYLSEIGAIEDIDTYTGEKYTK